MGQSVSSEVTSAEEDIGWVQDEILRQARTLTEIASLTYDEFKDSLLRLNTLSDHCVDSSGKRIMFAIKKGTDSTLLWRSTVRIACVKIDPRTKEIEQHHFLTLAQFLRVCKSFQSRLMAARSVNERRKSEIDMQDGAVAGCNSEDIPTARLPTAETLLREVTSENCSYPEKLSECCICLERKPEVMLPCAHSYCLLCIEEWNVIHKTCPICRETLNSTDDSWVIPEVPGSHEMTEELCSALMSLAIPSKVD